MRTFQNARNYHIEAGWSVRESAGRAGGGRPPGDEENGCVCRVRLEWFGRELTIRKEFVEGALFALAVGGKVAAVPVVGHHERVIADQGAGAPGWIIYPLCG